MGSAIRMAQSKGEKGASFAWVANGSGREMEARRLRLLLVEDEAIPALLMEQTLTALGYEVCEIADSESAALQAVERHRPDLILMDIRLADGGDGVNAATQARDRFGIPSVFITAQGDPATRRRAEQARPIGFLLKPYSAGQVRETLARAGECLRKS